MEAAKKIKVYASGHVVEGATRVGYIYKTEGGQRHLHLWDDAQGENCVPVHNHNGKKLELSSVWHYPAKLQAIIAEKLKAYRAGEPV